MSIAISALTFVIVIFSFTLSLFDINKQMELRQVISENTRAANQNSLLEISEDYKNNEVISTSLMLEKWLTNFFDDNLSEVEELEINFSMISTEPPLFLVSVKGKSSANAYLSAELYANIMSGTTIITYEK